MDKKAKEKLVHFAEGLRKVAMIAATHPATFAIFIVAADKTVAMINRAVAEKKDGTFRSHSNKVIDETLAHLSDLTVNLGLAAALAPVAVSGLGVVQAAVTRKQPT